MLQSISKSTITCLTRRRQNNEGVRADGAEAEQGDGVSGERRSSKGEKRQEQ